MAWQASLSPLALVHARTSTGVNVVVLARAAVYAVLGLGEVWVVITTPSFMAVVFWPVTMHVAKAFGRREEGAEH